MIDNINLRLHGCNQPILNDNTNIDKYSKGHANLYVPEHFELYKKILETKGKKGFEITKCFNQQTVEHNTLSEEDFLVKETSNKLNTHYLSLDKVYFASDKQVKERNFRVNGRYNVTSSEHDVVYSINIDGGFIDFNINLPKYLFGHNLAQFVPQIKSSFFNGFNGNMNNWEVQKTHLYDRLIKFIEGFFTDLFIFFRLETLPNWDYIELTRIDLCYNQFFETKTDALMYLEEQKKIHKKSTSAKSNVSSNYKTSIAYHTSNGSYFKIYHKGSEYIGTKNGDFKKHNSLNKDYISKQYKYRTNPVFAEHANGIFQLFKNDTLGKFFEAPESTSFKFITNQVHKDLPINTMFLKNQMDKVLRYEISLTSKTLSRIYTTRIFRNRCAVHNRAKRIYNQVRRYDSRVKKGKKRVFREDRRQHDEFKRFINSRCCLIIGNNKDLKKHSSSGRHDYNPLSAEYKISKLYHKKGMGTLLEKHHVAYFNRSFLNLLVDKFLVQIKEFQLEELKPFDDLVKKVREYNRQADENKRLYDELNDYRTWKNGQRIIKGNKVITKASQLLTEKQKNEKHLKGINITQVSEIFRLMHEEKMSPSQVKEYLGFSKSAWYRRIKLLQMLGVKENSLNMPKRIKTSLDFQEYYYLTNGYKFAKNFFLNPKHATYNTFHDHETSSTNNLIPA